MLAETDRILRPGGKLIVRDKSEMIKELEGMVKSMQWKVLTIFTEEKDGFLSVEKSYWRPAEVESLEYAYAAAKDLLRENTSNVIP